jgi:hypothetical protein
MQIEVFLPAAYLLPPTHLSHQNSLHSRNFSILKSFCA